MRTTASYAAIPDTVLQKMVNNPQVNNYRKGLVGSNNGFFSFYNSTPNAGISSKYGYYLTSRLQSKYRKYFTKPDADPEKRLKITSILDNKVLKFSLDGHNYYFKYVDQGGDYFNFVAITRDEAGVFDIDPEDIKMQAVLYETGWLVSSFAGSIAPAHTYSSSRNFHGVFLFQRI